MRADALRPYEASLLAPAPSSLALVCEDETLLHLDVARWMAPVDETDTPVLDRCVGPVLDVGCGPGRFVRALGERGIAALGVDISDAAVELTRRLGVPALGRSIFDQVPGEGRWATVLLMDGNLGIGGDVPRLLSRTAQVMRYSGRVIVESSADGDVDEVLSVRFSAEGSAVGPSFEWARMGIDALQRRAVAAGYYVEEVFTVGGRSFACLRRSARASRITVAR
ncbi:methyltransferase family protein [Jatrophihabitans sp. GAS493]|uniref:class I SAM-dependent methyltransferase n=1 Tax=Jatrophihabitans sp. GAS493 TaxID=1907575 RepID=UPI000BB92C7C|nr:class I SAM-dependent methyltransferase [Jatrophihabitans sp. GAS493]SOD72041.1 methyltransferase family protein [Jatrophihabitans sp. GAS493]